MGRRRRGKNFEGQVRLFTYFTLSVFVVQGFKWLDEVMTTLPREAFIFTPFLIILGIVISIKIKRIRKEKRLVKGR